MCGLGWLAISYSLLSVNVLSPTFAFIYWQDDMSFRRESGMNLVTMFGAIIGATLAGFLGDKCGRKIPYIVALVGLIIGNIFFGLCSNGERGSLNIYAMFLVGRIFVGICRFA